MRPSGAAEGHAHYKGCAITTRGSALVAPSDEFGDRFSASFSVGPPDSGDSAWQEFPDTAFDTLAEASDNALELARQSIDMKLSQGLVVREVPAAESTGATDRRSARREPG